MHHNSVVPSASRLHRLAALLAVAAIGFGAAACGGSDDASSTTSVVPTTASPSGGGDEPVSSGAADSPTDEGADDLCQAVTAEQIGAVLTEATIVAAQPNDVIPAPTCDYMVSIDGIELPAVKVIREESGFYDSQKAAQETQVPVEGVADAFATDDQNTHVYLEGASGDYQIDVGVELTSGGQPASAAQMAAIARLFADL